jgi:hypothetical protein
VRRWRRALELGLVLVLLYFVGGYLVRHWREVRSYPWDVAPGPLIAATLLGAAALVSFALLWRGLLAGLGQRVGLRQGLAIWLVSALARYIPGKFWHMSGMAYLARRSGVNAVHALGANLLLQTLIVAIGTLVFVLTVPAQIAAVGGSRAEIAIAAVALALVLVYLSPIFDRLYARGLALLRQPGAVERLSTPQKLRFGAGTALAWILNGASFWLFVNATAGRAPPLGTAIGICAAGYVAGFLAFFSPGGLIVRESLYAVLLQPYVPPSVALAVALLNRLWLTIIEIGLAAAASAMAGIGRTSRDEPVSAPERPPVEASLPSDA